MTETSRTRQNGHGNKIFVHARMSKHEHAWARYPLEKLLVKRCWSSLRYQDATSPWAKWILNWLWRIFFDYIRDKYQPRTGRQGRKCMFSNFQIRDQWINERIKGSMGRRTDKASHRIASQWQTRHTTKKFEKCMQIKCYRSTVQRARTRQKT